MAHFLAHEGSSSDPVACNEAGEPLYNIGVDLDKVVGSVQKKEPQKASVNRLEAIVKLAQAALAYASLRSVKSL